MIDAAGLASRLHLLAVASRDQQLADARSRGRDPADACLRHTAASVPRYTPLRKSGTLAEQSLPLVSRDILAERPEDFISCAFADSELRWRTTSGTSGMPLSVPRDRASDYVFVYDTYRILFERLPELTGRASAGALAVLQVNDNPSRAAAVAVNPSLGWALMRQVVIGHDPDADRLTARMAMDERPALVTGRPRALLAFADLLADQPNRTSEPLAAALVCSGDNLHGNVRRTLEEAFGAPAYNAYASREAGLVALECPARSGLHAVDGRASIEVLPDGAAEPVGAGTGELVVSNYENWAMPVLRYRTGDRATVITDLCSCGRAGQRIVGLDGRDSPYFMLGDRRFNPSLLNETLEALPLRQFHLLQRLDQRFEFRWVPRTREAEQHDQVTAAVEAALRAFGPAEVRVEQVERLGAPGKKLQRYERERAFAMSR